jgi:hypothetical protein
MAASKVKLAAERAPDKALVHWWVVQYDQGGIRECSVGVYSLLLENRI